MRSALPPSVFDSTVLQIAALLRRFHLISPTLGCTLLSSECVYFMCPAACSGICFSIHHHLNALCPSTECVHFLVLFSCAPSVRCLVLISQRTIFSLSLSALLLFQPTLRIVVNLSHSPLAQFSSTGSPLESSTRSKRAENLVTSWRDSKQLSILSRQSAPTLVTFCRLCVHIR